MLHVSARGTDVMLIDEMNESEVEMNDFWRWKCMKEENERKNKEQRKTKGKQTERMWKINAIVMKWNAWNAPWHLPQSPDSIPARSLSWNCLRKRWWNETPSSWYLVWLGCSAIDWFANKLRMIPLAVTSLPNATLSNIGLDDKYSREVLFC